MTSLKVVAMFILLERANMTDKIKKGLSLCLAEPGSYDGTWTEHCFECPYYPENDCKRALMLDIKNHFKNVKNNILEYAAQNVEERFDSNISSCKVSNCNKPDSIGCGNRICIDENIELEKKRIEDIFNGKE